MGRHFSPQVWTCPSDPLNAHHTWVTSGAYKCQYPYSYSMNSVLNPYPRPSNEYSSAYFNGQVARMVSVRHASDTVMMIEESENTIDDGNAVLCVVGGSTGNWTYDPAGTAANGVGGNLLAVRHDGRRRLPDAGLSPADQEGLPNSGCRGNAAFCDGHAGYVTRQFVHGVINGKHWDWTN